MAGVIRRQEVAAAVSVVWEKFRGPTLERVAALEGAARALAAGDLGAERRRDAERDAHRLAGAVGTFGFPRGSELGRSSARLAYSFENPLRIAEGVELLASLR